jgi:Holliday junction resolvase RusA-like endonuclease
MGEPKGKGRPRFSVYAGHVHTRTPEDTVVYENLIRTEYKYQCGQFKFTDDIPLELRVYVFKSIPKSISQKKRQLMIDGEIRPTTKPDFDNITKAVCDALNGVAYHDDSQIVDSMTRKFYAEQPRIEIIIKQANKN